MNNTIHYSVIDKKNILSFLETKVLPIGFFALLTGLLWLPGRGDYHRVVYLLLLIPGLILLLSKGRELLSDLRELPPIVWSIALFLGWYAISASWSDGGKSVADLLKLTYI